VITQERFARCVLENRNRDFWEEVKRIKNSKKKMSVVLLMVCLIVVKLQTFSLINVKTCIRSSVPYNSDEMEAINVEVNSCLDGFTNDCVVSFNDVVEAVNYLKFGKMMGILVYLLIKLNTVETNYLYIYLCYFHPCWFTVWFQLIY